MNRNSSQQDVPVPIALLFLFGLLGGYAYFNYFRMNPLVLERMVNGVQAQAKFWWISLAALLVNLTFAGVFIRRTMGLEKQGSKLQLLEGKSNLFRFGKKEFFGAIGGGIVFAITRGHSIMNSLRVFTQFVSVGTLNSAELVLSLNLTGACFFLVQFVLKIFEDIPLSWLRTNKLNGPVIKKGELLLGTSDGELTHLTMRNTGLPMIENWVKIPERGMNGGIFISGSPGSGKTQGTILPYLKQLLSNSDQIPAILAIDPKGTFLRQAERIIIQAGHQDRMVKISLGGQISFNPVYCERPLKNSKFADLAEMVRSAAVNFMGKSSDSPFWDVSSSHLIRNAIVYCAAVHGYFTLLDLYRAIVRATDEEMVDELRLASKNAKFDDEEKFNIECAVQYFEHEYSQLEDRVRTGIVATSTAFINQFQEYSTNRIFCPSEEELSISSMEDLIREGKILLFDVQRPGLARSMGTFIKLHFEQAVLNMISELKAQHKPVTSALIVDEYQDVVTCGGGGTIGDDSFMAKARETKPLVIVATQSLSSLMNAIGSQRPALELLQNFRTRIACHSSDIETIRLFQELFGKEEIDSETHSLSETAKSAKLNFLAGGFDSKDSSLNESVSRAKRREDIVTGKEFSRLKTFEAFAQVFDGVTTRFMRLYLKPEFLKKINTKHGDVLAELTGAKEPTFREKLKAVCSSAAAVCICFSLPLMAKAQVLPNACTVVNTPSFQSCLELTTGGCTCGFPPHPCAEISYYVPQTFIEVWPEPRLSYFSALPGVAAQFSSVLPTPFGAEADDDSQSFHAHAVAVPMASLIFNSLPSGGTRMEKVCFDGMSEHFGPHWNTGKSDLLQPLFLAWSAAPKVCLLSGAATSITGTPNTAISSDSAVCSFPVTMPTFPPSSHSACNGWGTFYPRYGTYSGPASMSGALMIGSRIKSLAAEVLHSMPSSPDEKWQMIYPGASSCFREGQNVAILETIKNARETSRLVNGKLKGYLFVVWARTTACKEMPTVAQAKAAELALPGACRGAQ